MARVTPMTVEYELVDGTKAKDRIYVRRLRYSNGMRLIGILMYGINAADVQEAPKAPEAAGNAQESAPQEMDKGKLIQNALYNTAQYNLELIASRVCTKDGKQLYTADDIDAWSEPDAPAELLDTEGAFVDDAAAAKYEELAQNGSRKIKAYAAALDVKPKTAHGIAKNSEATPTASSSSS